MVHGEPRYEVALLLAHCGLVTGGQGARDTEVGTGQAASGEDTGRTQEVGK